MVVNVYVDPDFNREVCQNKSSLLQGLEVLIWKF